MIRSPKLVTFDCYGTLIDWFGGLEAALRELGLPEGDLEAVSERYVAVEAEIEAGPYLPYRKVMAIALERVLEEYGRPLSPGRREILGDSLPRWKPFEETTAVLLELARRADLAILSNIDNDLLEASVRVLEAPIRHRVTAQDLRSYKPAHHHFRRIQQIAGLGPDEILHVAASLRHDQEPCRELGLRSVWINRRNEPRPDWLPEERVLTDLRPLPALVFGPSDS
jgi:2-haloalkanoic acid dehalogenase type II